MKLIGIVACFSVFVSSFAMKTSERHGRSYEVARDIGFRWRTTLNVDFGDAIVYSDEEHLNLKKIVDSCHPNFIIGGANVAAAGLQIVFSDKATSRLIQIHSRINKGVTLSSAPSKNVTCFTTACLERPPTGGRTRPSFPPITYERNSLEFSIPFIFRAICMSDEVIVNVPEEATKPKYNYRDTEFQVVHELFSPIEERCCRACVVSSVRVPRFMEIFSATLKALKKETKDVALIVLHIHTKFDPCAVCAEMLCNLSQTLNYLPERLLTSEESQVRQLCEQLKSHHSQFLIEVSSEIPYWNSREAGLDEFYMRQLSDIAGFGMLPAKILDPDNFSPVPSSPSHEAIISDVAVKVSPLNYFPPLVIFKRIDPPVIFKCLKMDKEKLVIGETPDSKVGEPPM